MDNAIDNKIKWSLNHLELSMMQLKHLENQMEGNASARVVKTLHHSRQAILNILVDLTIAFDLEWKGRGDGAAVPEMGLKPDAER